MDIEIKHSAPLRGTIQIPPSKSYGQRAIALSLLTKKLRIKNLGNSEDEIAALNIIRQSGASITRISDSEILIKNDFQFDKDIEINCGESGLSARLFSSLFLLNSHKTTINGEGSLLKRPMTALQNIFEQLDVQYRWNDSKLPISYIGKRKELDLEIDGSISSQFITGMLYYMVGMRSSKPLRLKISEPKSVPYIDMTIQLLTAIGVNIQRHGNDELEILPSKLLEEAMIEIEGDWSAAANWMVAAAIDGDITITGLNMNSLQADKKILDIVRDYGAQIILSPKQIRVISYQNKGFRTDITNCPDLFPILSILAISANTPTTIYGIQRLIHKESNRLASVIHNFLIYPSLYSLYFSDNFIKINGINKNFNSLQNVDYLVFNSFDDHRIAMASTILATNLYICRIEGFNAVKKSYPNFLLDFKMIGGDIYYL